MRETASICYNSTSRRPPCSPQLNGAARDFAGCPEDAGEAAVAGQGAEERCAAARRNCCKDRSEKHRPAASGRVPRIPD